MFNKIMEICFWLKNSNTNLNNALYYYKNIDELPHFKKVWSRRNFFARYLHAFMIFFKRIITSIDKRRLSKALPENITTILYINSNNTFDSLKFLKMNDDICFLEQSNRISLYKSPRKNITHNIRTPIWIIILSFFNFPIFIIFFWRKCFYYPQFYFENWGKDYVNVLFLKQYKKINKVIFANDHNVENRLFKIASEEQKIKTIYLQHASVTELFPKLDFNQSFLFGEVDFKKYKLVGEMKGDVVFVGAPKFDKLYEHRRYEAGGNNNLGLALNTIDESDLIISFVNNIIAKTNYNVIIRMHPDDMRNFNFISTRIKLHSANDIKLIDFFSEIDFLFSADSSIHLESLYLNIPSYYTKMNNLDIKDSYHFLAENLITVFDFKNISDDYFYTLSSLKTINRKTLKKFISSIGEPYDGNVGELIINEIRNNNVE